MWHRNDSCFIDCRMFVQNVFDLLCGNVLPATDNDVLFSAGNRKKAILGHCADIARSKKTLAVEGRLRCRHARIATKKAGTAHQYLSFNTRPECIALLIYQFYLP